MDAASLETTQFGTLESGYLIWYLGAPHAGHHLKPLEADSMPALNITFTDDEMAEIRDATAKEDTSMKTFAHEAVLAAVHRRKVASATARAIAVNAGINKRLAEK